MTLTIFVAVVGYILLLVIVVGAAAGTARRLWALGEAIASLAGRVDTLSERVDEARHATHVVPERIIDAYERSYQRAP
jgi:type IV secretory pathway TrbD component